ncbi:MAG TPA: 2-amino-4-hydroxy-6-hydroxymethyldihydropteridine diphosphokinase [Micromonosporaceae bacterium]
MTVVVCSLGANLGDRLARLRDAVDGLRAHRVSGVYETPPWGDLDQPRYLNAVAVGHHPSRTPRDWLALAQSIETRAGRIRDPARRYGPRPLDIDLIAMWTESGDPVLSDDPELTLPHPLAWRRAFVLVPWLELDPDAILPGHGRVADLVAGPEVNADTPGVHRRCDLVLRPVADCTR